MKQPRILTVSELQAICSKDNGEPLVSLQEECNDIICDYRKKDSGLDKVLVRKSVAEKLKSVQKRIQAYDRRMQLVVVDGYRRPDYQRRYFLKELLAQHQKEPTIDLQTLIEQVHRLVALPSVAGHPSGGAVDLTIACGGQEIDMGGEIADFSNINLLPTYSNIVSEEQRRNRLLLCNLMLTDGFAPYYGEWWHFSYGDREWAGYYLHFESLYSSIYFD